MRLDFFFGHPGRMVQINEVSYPSHHTYPTELRRQWAAGYPLQGRGQNVRLTLTLTLALTRSRGVARTCAW